MAMYIKLNFMQKKKTILMWRVGFYSRRLIQIYLLLGINTMYLISTKALYQFI